MSNAAKILQQRSDSLKIYAGVALENVSIALPPAGTMYAKLKQLKQKAKQQKNNTVFSIGLEVLDW